MTLNVLLLEKINFLFLTLQFADVAMILGKWSLDNAINLSRILRCFHVASGLKVNFSKNKQFGVGVDQMKF